MKKKNLPEIIAAKDVMVPRPPPPHLYPPPLQSRNGDVALDKVVCLSEDRQRSLHLGWLLCVRVRLVTGARHGVSN